VPAVEAPGHARRFVARHWLVLALFVAGGLLRVAAQAAYPYAFFYNDSRPYIEHAITMGLHTIRPFGYSAFLKPFVWSGADAGRLVGVAVAQSLMIMVLAGVVYAYLVRRGVRTWISALSIAPLLLAPSEIILERYILAEALFTTLLILGLAALAWPWPRTRIRAALAGGLLLAAAALTRTIGLPVCALGGLYLLILVRRHGWRPLVAYTGAVLAPLAFYLVAYHHTYGVYAFGQYQGRFLYARTMTIADCSHVSDQRLCTPTDPARRPDLIDWYVWSPQSPANVYHPGRDGDADLGAFAREVITAQPAGYAAMVARETAWYFVPAWQPADRDNTCQAERWLPTAQTNLSCGPQDFTTESMARPRPVPPPSQATAASRALTWYGGSQTGYGPLMGLALLWIIVASVLWRWRALDGLLFGSAGFTIILVSVATSMFEPRYAIPVIPLVAIGAALAVPLRRSGAA